MKKRRFSVNSDEAMTIMPDGRPLFAWENEILGAERDWELTQKILKECNKKMQLLRIAEIEIENESCTGDIIVRFSRMDAIADTYFEQNLVKHYKRIK